MDHLTLVTVDGSEVSIANILMEGILGKTGGIPLNGDELRFEQQADVPSSSRRREE
jgi:hypothetical protein